VLQGLTEFFTAAFFAAGVRLATPLIFTAIGGIFSERSGVVNIGLEGMMLTGAFAGVVGAFYTGNAWLGVLTAMAAGALMALIHAFLSVTIRGDQIVSGAAINILGLGLTTYSLRIIWGLQDKPHVAGFAVWKIPVLGDIPFIGEVLFQHIPLVYLAFLLVPVAHFVLFRTSWGLSLRSVGEHPRAADTLGISVVRTRYICVLISGALAGLGGAFLSIGQLQTFLENMSAGRGFIALAALIFGKWMPVRTMAACLLFGGAQAATVRIPALNYSVSPQLLSMFPYLLTLLTFVGLVGKTTPPAAEGTPYVKE
jgi:ABC-type uncharacterized transport system permease subunit